MEPSPPSVGNITAAAIIIGDKWTPELLRLFINHDIVRFCQLQDFTDGINPRTLSARLSMLEQTGIIEKLAIGSTSRCEYRLTTKGRDLLPILHMMEKWSKKYATIAIL